MERLNRFKYSIKALVRMFSNQYIKNIWRAEFNELYWVEYYKEHQEEGLENKKWKEECRAEHRESIRKHSMKLLSRMPI